MTKITLLLKTDGDRYFPFAVWAKDVEAAILCARVHLLVQYKLEVY